MNSNSETVPSLDAQANTAPKSGGDHSMLLTEDVWAVCSKSLDQVAVVGVGVREESRQMRTRES